MKFAVLSDARKITGCCLTVSEQDEKAGVQRRPQQEAFTLPDSRDR